MEPQLQIRTNGDRSNRSRGRSEIPSLEPEDWFSDLTELTKVFYWVESRVQRWLPPEEANIKSAPPKELRDISEAIKKSRDILKLGDDWDGENSPAYREETWSRATNFLWSQAEWFWDRYGMVFDAPRIAPGPNGSIDIHWKTEAAELLINIPVDKKTHITFYGDTKAGSHISGSMKDSDHNRGIWFWLKEDSSSLGR
jgi:hypothetical protein